MQRLVGARRDQLDRADERLSGACAVSLDARRVRARAAGRQVHALSPLQSLARGYAVPLDADGTVLRRRADFTTGALRLRVADGVVPCRVERQMRSST
jgi:exodeoxyribonuclease VII large subunit